MEQEFVEISNNFGIWLKLLDKEMIAEKLNAPWSRIYRYSRMTREELMTRLTLFDVLALEKYVLEQRESKYPFVALPKKEIRENKGEKGEGALAKRTKDIMAGYDIHVTANDNFKVDSTLGETENQEDLTTKEIRKKINSFDGQGLTFTQKTFVGGFIDQDKLPFNADYMQIYQENGRFYYPMKDEDPLLV